MGESPPFHFLSSSLHFKGHTLPHLGYDESMDGLSLSWGDSRPNRRGAALWVIWREWIMSGLLLTEKNSGKPCLPRGGHLKVKKPHQTPDWFTVASYSSEKKFGGVNWALHPFSNEARPLAVAPAVRQMSLTLRFLFTFFLNHKKLSWVFLSFSSTPTFSVCISL